jgi:hypothetical protein
VLSWKISSMFPPTKNAKVDEVKDIMENGMLIGFPSILSLTLPSKSLVNLKKNWWM